MFVRRSGGLVLPGMPIMSIPIGQGWRFGVVALPALHIFIGAFQVVN